MQSIDQMSIPADAVKHSVQLPIVKDIADERHCGLLINETLLELHHHGSGPVHINVPVTEYWEEALTRAASVRRIHRHVDLLELPVITAQRILVAVGQHRPFKPEEQQALDQFAARYGALVHTNRLSNYHGPNSMGAGLVMAMSKPRSSVGVEPDLLITIGGQIGDYGFDSLMRSSNVEHWRVSQDGPLLDSFGRLKRVFECKEQDFFEAYTSQRTIDADDRYVRYWRDEATQRALPKDLPLSHAYVAQVMSPLIPPGSVVHFGILNSLRNWNNFDSHPSVRGFSNVGAFGIDGCLSTFIGHSVSIDAKAFLVIGDLSFFYDMNAIGNRHVKSNARVLVVNNNGGAEFRLYNHEADRLGDASNRHIAASGHHGSARGWAESMGWEYQGVRTKEELRANADRFVGDSARPVLMEVFTTMRDDSEGLRMLQGATTPRTLERKIAGRLSPGTKRIAKRVLGRG
jgi:2-succinyl-5-enolpyruvyl-6-hydroxy-3-cyclohexene-1-carboxylate synthase